jgi:hypothetical protein
MSAEIHLQPLIAQMGGAGLFVEVGVLRATNLLALAERFPLLRLVGVDSYCSYTDLLHGSYVVHGNLSRLNRHIAEKRIEASLYKDRIELWVEDSSQASTKIPDGTVDIVFIDKNICEESLIKDVLDWYPKVRTGGILCGHDAYTSGVLRGAKTGLTRCGINATLNMVGNEVWWVRV